MRYFTITILVGYEQVPILSSLQLRSFFCWVELNKPHLPNSYIEIRRAFFLDTRKRLANEPTRWRFSCMNEIGEVCSVQLDCMANLWVLALYVGEWLNVTNLLLCLIKKCLLSINLKLSYKDSILSKAVYMHFENTKLDSIEDYFWSF